MKYSARNTMGNTLYLLVIFVISVTYPSWTFAKTIYLDCQSGNDANSGTGPNVPKQDFHGLGGAIGAADAAAAGDTILVKRGIVCNFTQSQPINKSVHITSSATYYAKSLNDPLPILSSYSVWSDGWTNIGSNIWKHNINWPGRPTPIHYLRFSALGISNAGPAELSLTDLVAPKQYFYYWGTGPNDPPYVAVYSQVDPKKYYGPVYYSMNGIFWFTNIGNGAAVSSGMRIDYLAFENVDIGIGIFPLDANFNGGNIENIQCIDVHRCVQIEGDNGAGDTLSNFSVQNSTITGASGPAIQINGIDRLNKIKINGMRIKTTGVSESYGGIYTNYINANLAAIASDFQIYNNVMSDCRTGNLYIADGACVENDMGTSAALIYNNVMSMSHQCYHSNSGGVTGLTTAPSRGLYFENNTCNNTDTLAFTSDSEGVGNGLVYIRNNKLINGSINRFAPQVPYSNGLVAIFNGRAVGIHVENNFIGLSPSFVNGAYGIANAMASPSYVTASGNTYSANLIAPYKYIGGGS